MRLLLFLLISAASLSLHAGKDDYPFAVTTEKMGAHFRVLAKNGGPSPIATRISLTLSDGAASDRAWPVTLTVPPGRTLPVGNVFASRAGQAYHFHVSSAWILGEINAQHDTSIAYRFPFADGARYLISQAPGGPITTHTDPGSLHAVDFTMPEGTLVLAARAGVVVRVESGYTEGGTDPALLGKSNEVTVLHKDGTMAVYAHLGPGRQLVSRGQVVQAGSPLGFSGSTGFSSGAHLHFAVMRAIARQDGMPTAESLPITFYAFNPPKRFTPRAGMMALAEYGKPESQSVAFQTQRPEASGETHARSDGTPQALSISFDLTSLMRMKDSLDELLGSPIAGWIALVAPVFLLLWFGLAPAANAPSMTRKEPAEDREVR